jgi:uncharacterized protein YndB with AHSA1/START domain
LTPVKEAMMSETIEAKVTHRFRASPERVFDAFVDPALMARWQLAWFRRSGAAEGTGRTEIEPRVGGRFLLANGRAIPHWGTFLALDRPTRIAFSWENEGQEPSLVSFIIEPEPNGPGCVVTLYNTLDAQLEDGVPDVEREWMAMLGGIEDVIERRDIPALS